jgi:hypothetical protein
VAHEAQTVLFACEGFAGDLGVHEGAVVECVGQERLGWGPTKDAHLLKPGEIAKLVAPFEVVHAREAFEPADEAQWAALASVLAQRAK